MTEASEGQRAFGTTSPGPLPTADSGAASPPGPSQALLGPFTLREVVFGGGVALVFIGTLLPFLDGVVRYATFWNSQPLFFIGIGVLVPVIALALLAGRRLGSHGLRVGSLSVDQFASVSAVLAVFFFFLQTVTAFHAGPLLALIGALGMLAATVVGPFLPVIRNDFAERPEVPAHTAARPITAARPRPARPAKAATYATSEASGTTPRVAAVTSGPAPAGSGSSSAERSTAHVNPAAAAARQNGAGLYGAGGAGAVGAGAAASGQSGIERSASQEPVREDPTSQAAPAASGAPGAPGASTGTGAHTVDQSGRPGRDSEDQVAPRDASVTDPASRHTQPTPVERTRVHEIVGDGAEGAAGGAREERIRQEPITATRSAGEEPVVEAFWFAVGSSRPVFDEQTGQEIFTLQPGDWEVGVEDRDHEFLVQDKRTGAVGILRDLHNIERAPRD